MIRSFLGLSLLATSSLAPAIAAAQVPAGNSAPQPVPIIDTIPEAKDVRFPGTLQVNVDATDTQRGIFRVTETIPVPAAGEEVCPDIVIAPVVGYDRNAYRLGYGGGYFDRTLAAIPRRPMIIGVGYSQAAIPTIYPQLHDIPMDKIVIERDIFIPEVKVSAANS